MSKTPLDSKLTASGLTTAILDGKLVAQARRAALGDKVGLFRRAYSRSPGLAVVRVGNDPASEIYVRHKVEACEAAGIKSFHIEKPATISQTELEELIDELNLNPDVDGILVQLPLPKGLNETKATERIFPSKDPDGLTSGNLGLLFADRVRVAPCTPLGVMKILEHYKIDVAGMSAVVVGRSNIVGKPMAQLLLQANATVTVAHSKTRNLRDVTRSADIAVVAAGKPRLLGKDDFKPGAIVIDVGIHRIAADGGKSKLCGDVRAEELHGVVAALTPVPGGVGPMTIQMLLENTLTLSELRQKSAK